VRHLRRADIAKYLVPLFNNAKKFEKVPVKWCKSCMIFIPKGENPYTGIVKNLRPITLLETIQKIFIKTILYRITNILVKKSILKGTNTSGLPDTSTYDSLLPLAVFIKESHRTKREGHLFLEEKSAAFDSITYAHIKIGLKRIGVDTKFIKTYMNMRRRRESRVITAYGLSQPFKYGRGVPRGGVESPLIWNFAYDIGLAGLKKENWPFKSVVLSPLSSPQNARINRQCN
jgi:Reverse transcriptase (RNA-dependent DNA polymerase)